jgi:cobalamin biosynthesis Mg chelatase CobN
MAQKRNLARVKDANVSPFLGIGEGKVAAANAAADVAREQAATASKMADALIAEATQFNAAKAAADAAAANTTAATTTSKYTVYIVVGVVLVLMVGLYFIVKRVKK